MLKSILMSSLLIAGAALAAPPDEAPVPVKFSVSSAKEALLSGDAAVLPNRPATIERHAARGPERQALTLELRPLEDGRLLVRATWSDTTRDGELVKWEPSFIVKRSADAEVRLDFPGGARVLKLSAG